MRYSNEPLNKEFRRILRHNMTSAERILWKRLKNKQLDGWRFRRQHGYGDYVLDFYCPVLKLCIEVDGNIHDIPEVKDKDENRSIFLEHNGIRILRFRNEEIENNIDAVVQQIRTYIDKKIGP